MAWATMAALAELASRPRRPEFAADEVAAAFGLTWLSAARGDRLRWTARLVNRLVRAGPPARC
jgi:membrane-bound lytic murein transglycosylase B